MEDANGGLFVSERSLPTIEQISKEADKYDELRMGDSRRKGIGNYTAVPGRIDGLQHFKGNNNIGFNVDIGQTI